MNCCIHFGAIFLLFTASFANQGQAINATIQSCCDHVSQWNDCYSACMQFASNCSPETVNMTQYLLDFCPQIPSALSQCITNVTSSEIQPTPPPQLLQCCNQSPNPQCREECIKQVTIGDLDSPETIQMVISVCGLPFSANSDPIWACLLNYNSQQQQQNQQTNTSNQQSNSQCITTTTTPTPAPSTPQPLSIKYADWPRLHCCSKANDSKCSEACYYEYTGSRTTNSWETLNTDCIYRATEGPLVSCLHDVTARCTQDCSGLNFCSNFNNRPLTSFRHCTALGDHNAKTDYYTWLKYNRINHPLVQVSFTNLTSCYPEHWKILACSFQIQPCQPTTHTSLICKEDCLFLMNACRDNNFATQTNEEICETLSPSYLQANCISLDTYLNRSQYNSSSIATPCSPNPCVEGRTCVPNHQCTGGRDCQQYHCVKECQLGNRPELTMADTSIVHVSTLPSAEGNGCHGYVNRTVAAEKCTFGQKIGNLTREYCLNHDSCIYKGTNYTHGLVFADDCNVCSCRSGHVTCTSHSCNVLDSCSPPVCSCHPEYDPVCTTNGLTLPNVWFANCHGYLASQFTTGGSCSSGGDPCDPSPCSLGTKCIPHRHVCVSENGTTVSSCSQYKCVSSQTCADDRNEIVCATDGRQYSLCDIIDNQERVDYYGYCQDECSSSRRRPVCGVNGETFASSCHAKGSNIAVDYIGNCNDVPTVTGKCERSKCPGLPYFSSDYQCVGATPPGSCCPQCGSTVKLLVDQQQLARNRQALGVASMDSAHIIDRLRTLVNVLQCELYGHQAMDGSFILLILPTNATSLLNVEACNLEATRLSTLINRDSPIISSDVHLSIFVAANVSHAYKIKVVIPPAHNPVTTGCVSLRPSYFLCISMILLFVALKVGGWS